jgi:hypothetical protein
MGFLGALFVMAWLLWREGKTDEGCREWAVGFALGAVVAFWLVMSEEIYLYWDLREGLASREFVALMCVSIFWAVYGAALMVIGVVRKLRLLRYLALGLFALLLGKVFLVDMGNVKNVYRIGAFLATGMTLVGVSYLYQFLKKKGYFEGVL